MRVARSSACAHQTQSGFHVPNYLLVICSFIFSLAALTVPAQSPRPQSAPDLDLWAAGDVHAMAPTPDGGTVIAGYFAQVRGVRRNGLAKLNAEGNVDLSWNPIIGGPSYRPMPLT